MRGVGVRCLMVFGGGGVVLLARLGMMGLLLRRVRMLRRRRDEVGSVRGQEFGD